MLFGFANSPDRGYSALKIAPSSSSSSSPNSNSNSKLPRDRLKKLARDMGTPLIVVGGVGDSGTRGVQSLIAEFGLSILTDHRFVNKAGDSKIFHESYSVSNEMNLSFDVVRSRIKERFKLLDESFSFQYDPGRIFNAPREYDRVLNWFVGMLEQTFYSSGGATGFKNPQSTLILPLLREVKPFLPFKFVHVLRDGREVIRGDNVRQFSIFCHAVYQKKRCNMQDFEAFWADMNEQVLDYAQRYLGADSYYVIRSEDLVSGDLACYADFAKFLGKGVEGEEGDILAQHGAFINRTRTYATRYMGQRFASDEERSEILTQSTHRLNLALEFWGYHTNKFGTSKHCLDLDWRVKMMSKDK